MACSDIQPYQKRDVLGYYKLLGLSPDATAAEIRRSFYVFAKVYHPDKNPSPEAEVVFKGVLQAYEVLGDPEKREQYDNLTSSCDQYFKDDLNETHLPSFFLGTLLGNVFIYGASVGIIVCPLWGWILAPTLLCVVVAPTLFAKKCVKLAALCYGVAIAPIVTAEIGLKISCSVLSGVAGMIAKSLHSKENHKLEDIEEGWVNMEVEA
jgi:hypothetical protein